MWRFNELSYIWLHKGTNRTEYTTSMIHSNNGKAMNLEKARICIIWYTRLRPLSVRCIHDTFCGSSMSCKLGNIELYLWPVVFIWCLFALVYIYLLLSWVEKILLPNGFCHHCLFRKASHLWQEMAKSELIYYTQENTM